MTAIFNPKLITESVMHVCRITIILAMIVVFDSSIDTACMECIQL